MRSSTSVAALALALLQGTAAMNNNAFARTFNKLAEMGLNPDGTSMGNPSTDEDTFSITGLESLSAASGHSSSESVSAAAPEVILEEYVELPVDNFAQDKGQNYAYHGTFNNRYWVSTAAYKPGSPVFVYDVGEANANAYALNRLQNSTSFFKQIVDQYNGIGIVWEHRFYGNSSPTPIDINTPPEDFRYLTTEQSLADVDRFARQFSRKNINYTLTPDKTPWVFVGGSYPGMRAAFMRNKYPDTIFASYASSAPVQASVDQSFYYDPIWRGLNRYGFGNCTRDIQAAVRYIDRVFDSKNKTATNALLIKFLGLGAEKNSPETFADALATIVFPWQSYGVEGGTTGLRRFCDWLETDTDGMKPQLAGAEGHAPKKGSKWVAERWASYPWWPQNVNTYRTCRSSSCPTQIQITNKPTPVETECSGKANVSGTCDLNRQFSDPAMISWTWQYCTQWGFFQSANLGPRQLVSKYNSLQHQADICHRQFPTAPRSLLPAWPDVARTNRVFGGWSIRPSNTYWSNGEFDPWRTLSPASDISSAPKDVVLTQEAPRCGASTSRKELFGYVVPNAQHCYDFRTVGVTVPEGATSRGYFTGALTEWLACFSPRKGYTRPWRA